MRFSFGFLSFRHVFSCVLVLALGCGVFGRAHAGEKPWAFQTPKRSPLPVLRTTDRVRNPIDAFVLAKLENAGLTYSPEADRRTLIRRITFDLTGLPPTPSEIDAFVNDRAPDAYERLVERLLASPHYGERWATPWLDLARFAETDGFKADDPRPAAWRYRDYVIKSLNDDKPYDRFLREQIAGDELYPDDSAAVIATGFLRHYPDEYNAVNLEQRRQEILNDLTDTTTQVVLGLTVGCARCHDHKFDPITQEDYYRIQAFFAAYQPADVPVGGHEELARSREQLRAWEEKTADIRKQMSELEDPVRKNFQAKRKFRFPKEYQEMFDRPTDQRTPLQQQLACMVEKQVRASPDEVLKTMKPEVRQQWQDLQKRMADVGVPHPPALPSAMAMTDVGAQAPPTFLLKRGDWRHPGKEVPPGYLSAIDDHSAKISAPAGSTTTGRRSDLARWLTSDDNPLTARVMMNRLWQGHFGRGIVATTGDFGAQGEAPTHPELLDWLAIEFRARGWSLKEMHRLIVTSTAYRQGNDWNATAVRTDPDNKFLWRQNRRRLEGEVLRDAMLSVAGTLNARSGGPSIFPELPAELSGAKSWVVSADPAERQRRSVYIYVKRNLRYPLLSTFDAPDANETCSRRFTTTTAPQALMLFNGKLTRDVAKVFAARVIREVGEDPASIVEQSFRLALGRAPETDEARMMQTFLERQLTRHQGQKAGTASAVTELCHALLNLNEFLYVD
jgi:Protein of unknown function (DUF1553)/Protein of unknown function (DUF1549)